MNPIRIAGETRYIGPPKDWNAEKDGECEFLSVQDITLESGLSYMVSAWVPTEEELKRLNHGHPLWLWINGTPDTQHPVVSLAI